MVHPFEEVDPMQDGSERYSYLSTIRSRIDYNLVLDDYKRYCFSALGREYLDELAPGKVDLSFEYGLISEMISYVREYGLPDGDAFIDVRSLLAKVESGLILEGQELLLLARFFRGLSNVKSAIKQSRGPLFSGGLLAELLDKVGNYDGVVDAVRRGIDEHGNVKSEASPLLSKIRTEHSETLRQLRSKVEKFVNSHQALMQELTYTIKNDRYVLPIKANERGKVKGIVHGASSSGLTVYVEPEELIPLNDRLKLLQEEEAKEVTRILRELTSKIFNQLSSINKDLAILKRLDATIARARYAIDRNASLIQPSGSYLKLVKARHPLIEPGRVVPIDVELPTDKLGIVITGPNTGGKTVSLKTVALSILLARSGFPILVSESSRVPDVEIFIDIGDPQNVLENLSTFSGHVANIVSALSVATEGSLFLVDELGSGTDPYEGSALALGIIEELIERNIRFIVTTHLTPVKLYAMSHDKIVTASMEFDPETLSPTYRILMNVPGASHAFEIAERYGLDKRILERARKHLDEEQVRIEELIRNLNQQVSELESKKRELEVTLREYNRYKQEFEEKYKLLKVRRVEEFDKEIRSVYREIQEAKRSLQLALRSAKTASESLMRKRLKEIEAEVERVEEIRERLDRVLYETVVSEEDRSIEVGDTVRLIDGTVVGKVIEKKGKRLTVDFNGIRIEVKPERLVKVRVASSTVSFTQPDEVRREESHTFNLSAHHGSNELDVRGMTVEEAIERVDLFIDQLISSDQPYGYIIHGKGTGRLATGIWNHLRKDRRVKNYRFGRPDEGGVGVTVVEL